LSDQASEDHHEQTVIRHLHMTFVYRASVILALEHSDTCHKTTTARLAVLVQTSSVVPTDVRDRGPSPLAQKCVIRRSGASTGLVVGLYRVSGSSKTWLSVVARDSHSAIAHTRQASFARTLGQYRAIVAVHYGPIVRCYVRQG